MNTDDSLCGVNCGPCFLVSKQYLSKGKLLIRFLSTELSSNKRCTHRVTNAKRIYKTLCQTTLSSLVFNLDSPDKVTTKDSWDSWELFKTKLKMGIHLIFPRTLIVLVVLGFSYSPVSSLHHHHQNQNLTINLYYESLCPDCVDFISQKLCPLWEEDMSKYFRIDFVPYGNAETEVSKTGEITFECQHGPPECAANIVQACALKHLSYRDSIKFICCMEARHSAPGTGSTCAEELEVDYEPIQTCSEGIEGIKLHYALGKRTDKLQPKHDFVPWILFNGVYNQEDMEHAQEDLLSVVCKHLDPVPDVCNEIY